MNNKNMTALVSCFARAYHHKNNKYKIFDDFIAEKILSEKEYNDISINMSKGISFFNPKFKGTEEESLRWIVDNRLSPSVLGRSAFTEEKLINSIMLGNRQYLIYASGYDSFAYRNSKLLDKISVFEIDKKEVIEDKKKRLLNSNIDKSKINYIECDFTTNNFLSSIKSSKYDSTKISFSSLLGISYYLTKDEFINMIKEISNIITNGSSIVFDYPTYEESITTKTNFSLASASGEEMKSKYSYEEIEKILAENNLYIYEHLNSNEMTNNYFDKYNSLNPNNKIYAPVGVNYCLAVKQSNL